MPAEELFDVVDSFDRVLRVAPRSEVHAKQWLHRAVHIFVFNSRGELLIHRRSATKDEYPGCFTSSASGHLGAGEDYQAAAERELQEELGLSSPLERLARFPAGADTCFEHTVLYRTTTDTTPVFDPSEIESGEFLSVATIATRVADRPGDFTPCFRTIFRWFHATSEQGTGASGP